MLANPDMRLVAGKLALRLENCAAPLGGAIIFALRAFEYFYKNERCFLALPLDVGGD